MFRENRPMSLLVIHRICVKYLTFATFIFLYIFPLLFTISLLFDFLHYYLFV
jgi:hypothetical protein